MYCADRDLGTAHHTANELRITEVNSISEETLFTVLVLRNGIADGCSQFCRSHAGGRSQVAENRSLTIADHSGLSSGAEGGRSVTAVPALMVPSPDIAR